ncbi:MAG: GGDEF domain-containing protein [Gammaproteobacteria bacterium]|nr:GGDEF domain-containing protein [Gammaproteobacteria bacterium]
MNQAERAQYEHVGIQADLAGWELRDPVTGLPGPRLFVMEGEKELAFAQRHCSDLGLIFFQLDELAHAVSEPHRTLGDILVQQFVCCLKKSVRTEDTIARLDNTRFAVLARETNPVSARMLTRRVLARLRSMRGSTQSFSDLSVGIATPRAYRCQQFDEFVDLALQCLEKAVATGGGRVVAARTEENLRKLRSVPRRSGSYTDDPGLGLGTSPTQNLNIAMWLIEEGFIDQIEPDAGSVEKFAPLMGASDQNLEIDMGEVRVRLSRSA